MKYFDFKYEIEVSTKPEKQLVMIFLGKNKQSCIMDALDENNILMELMKVGSILWSKIDIKILDAIGRKWQWEQFKLIRNLPSRF